MKEVEQKSKSTRFTLLPMFLAVAIVIGVFALCIGMSSNASTNNINAMAAEYSTRKPPPIPVLAEKT